MRRKRFLAILDDVIRDASTRHGWYPGNGTSVTTMSAVEKSVYKLVRAAHAQARAAYELGEKHGAALKEPDVGAAGSVGPFGSGADYLAGHAAGRKRAIDALKERASEP